MNGPAISSRTWSAKRLIAQHPDNDIHGLAGTAADRTAPPSARIAAIYVLGFTDDAGLSNETLARILGDADEPAEVRDHAAEALSSITGARGAQAVDAHEALAISASTPFRARLDGLTLRVVLVSGLAPEEWWPHLNRAFTELPIDMLSRCLDEHPEGPARVFAMARMRKIAEAVDAKESVKAWLAGC